MDFIVEKVIAVLSERGQSVKRLTLTSWNGNRAKLDLRTWYMDDTKNEQQPGRGLTVSKEEAQVLVNALTDYLSGLDRAEA